MFACDKYLINKPKWFDHYDVHIDVYTAVGYLLLKDIPHTDESAMKINRQTLLFLYERFTTIIPHWHSPVKSVKTIIHFDLLNVNACQLDREIVNNYTVSCTSLTTGRLLCQIPTLV